MKSLILPSTVVSTAGKKGIVGLLNSKGQGRKPILSLQNPKHVCAVKAAASKNAQSVKAVIAELETVLDEKMSVDTLKRFLKNLVTVGAESAPRSNRGKWVLNEKKKKQL